jgi:tetratricopeptide (TPR) repeat protein
MRSLAAALLALALGLGACASDEEKKAEHLQRAEEHLAEGDLEAGLIELRSALQLAPQDASICLRIAEVLIDAGAPADAAFFFGEARRLDPQSDAAALGEAKLLYFTETARARELIDEVLARSPESSLAHARRSELALVESDSARALQEALLAVELAPDDAFAQMQLGIVRRAEIRERKLKNQPIDDELYRAAIAAFERAAAIAGRAAPYAYLTNAWTERAVVFATWPGHDEEAARAYREAGEAVLAVDLANERQANVLNTVAQYAEVKQNEELERWALERIVDVAPNRIEPWARLADLERQAGRSGAKRLEALLEKRPDDARGHALYARRLAAEDREPDALAYLEKQSEALAEPWPVLHALVRLRLAAEDLAAAKPVVDRLERERPLDAETQLLSAHLALAEGRLEDARTTLRKLVGQDERNAAAQRLLATVELQAGDARQAAAALRRAIELSEKPPATWIRELARAESRARNWTGARDAYLQLARREGPLNPQDRLGLARALYALGDAGAGRRALEKVLESPEAPVGASLLFANREGAREAARARELLEAAAARAPENEAVLRELVRLDARAGQPERALARLEGKDSVQARMLRAQLLVEGGRLDEATREVELAVEAQPDNPRGLELLSRLYQRQGRVEEAIRKLEESVRAGKAPVGHRVLLGRMVLERGDRARALEILDGVLGERSDLPAVKNDVAFLLSVQEGGDLRRALQLAREAREARPEMSEFADTLGYVYLRLEMTEAALDQLKSAGALAREGTPSWATAQFHLGLALKQAGRREEAAAALNRALAAAVEFPEAVDARRELQALTETAERSSSPS